jgi:hypothetical protein
MPPITTEALYSFTNTPHPSREAGPFFYPNETSVPEATVAMLSKIYNSALASRIDW